MPPDREVILYAGGGCEFRGDEAYEPATEVTTEPDAVSGHGLATVIS